MPNIISNELTIKGNQLDIQLFVNEYYTYNQFYGEKRWNIPNRDGIDYDLDEESCCLRFTTGWDTPREWLSNARQKYSSLKFTMFWMDTDDTPCCGIIESDGEEFSIMSVDDLKLACKLLNKHKEQISSISRVATTNISDQDIPKILSSQPKISVIQLSPGIYHEKDHNLVIRIGDHIGEYLCVGVYNSETKIISELTRDKIEICRQLGLNYVDINKKK